MTAAGCIHPGAGWQMDYHNALLWEPSLNPHTPVES